MTSINGTTSVLISAEQVSRLRSKRIFFGHQSVGADIVNGIRDLTAADPSLELRIVSSSDPHAVAGPALIESPIGANGDPRSKTQTFAAVINKGFGRQGGIAMYKYCYADIDASTDVQRLFADYRAAAGALKAGYPALTLVHITVPLTTVEPAAKAWVKGLLRRTTARDINAKRNTFNALLRSTYSGAEPLFDLAGVESTHVNGSRCYFNSEAGPVYSLASELTTDGGHLNAAGRRAAAQRLLLVLASL